MQSIPPASQSQLDPSEQVDRQEKTLDRLLEWIRAVEAKIPIIMAIDTGMLGVLATVSPPPKDLTYGSFLWVALGASPVVASLVLCALATLPQTKGPQGSLLYFGSIASKSLSDYTDAVHRRTETEYLSDLILQSYRNAEIATSKYAHLRRALLWLVVSIPPWLIALYALVAANHVAQ